MLLFPLVSLDAISSDTPNFPQRTSSLIVYKGTPKQHSKHILHEHCISAAFPGHKSTWGEWFSQSSWLCSVREELTCTASLESHEVLLASAVQIEPLMPGDNLQSSLNKRLHSTVKEVQQNVLLPSFPHPCHGMKFDTG